MSESILDNYRIILNVISLKAKNTHAVFCQETGRCLAFTNWMQTAKQMESEPNVRVWYYINSARIIPSSINLNLPFEYVFDPITPAFVKKPPTEEEAKRFVLFSEKSAVYDIVHRSITAERDHIRANLSLQDIIYNKKYEEATMVQYMNEARMDVPARHTIPYIYAECQLTGETPLQIANKILDKRKFVESRLLNTEIVRMKYTKLVRDCDNLFDLNLILDEFNRETNIYGRV